MSVEAAVARLEGRREDLHPGCMSTTGDGSMFVTYGRSFPSREARAIYAQVAESHARALMSELEVPEGGGLPPELQEYLERGQALCGLAKVDAEVVRVAAADLQEARWRVDGWNRAEKEAEGLAERLRAAPEEWDELLDEYGEPSGSYVWRRVMHVPILVTPPKRRGRLGPLSRHRLGEALGESVVTHFLHGMLLTDRIFFDLPVGAICGPYRGPYGYYLVKVLERLPSTRPLDLERERDVELLRDLWIHGRFVEYAHEALEMVGR